MINSYPYFELAFILSVVINRILPDYMWTLLYTEIYIVHCTQLVQRWRCIDASDRDD